MIQLRITVSTACAFDSLKAKVDRVGRALASGTTTTEALKQTERRLAELATSAKALRVAVRQEIAGAERRERDDRSTRKTA